MLNIFKLQNKNRDGGTPAGQQKNALPLLKANYQRYVDPTGEFDSKELKYSMWYVRHKVLLHRLLVAGLIGASTLLWGYSLLRWGEHFIFGLEQDTSMRDELARFHDYTVFHPVISARQPQIAGVSVFPGGVDKYDVIADVTNSNERFFVFFRYYFVVDGKSTPAQDGFLLPGENRPLAYLGLEGSISPRDATIVFEDFQWGRVSARQIPDVAAWQKNRLNFSVENFVFTPRNTEGGGDAHRVQFSVVNGSPYGYVEPQFYVALFGQDSLVGILPLRLDRLDSLEKKSVDLRSFVPSLAVDTVKLYPLINIYTSDAYLVPPR